MERLEKYVLENRQDFDQAVPNLDTWAAINTSLDQSQAPRIRRMSWWSIAAAVLFLLAAGGVGGAFISQRASQSTINSLAAVAPEYGEVESYLKNEFADRYQQLVSYEAVDPLIQQDLATLDAAFEQLQKDLSTVPPGAEEAVVHAIITHYKTKIELLERVLEKVRESKVETRKKEEDEINI